MKSIVWAGALVGLALSFAPVEAAPAKRKAPATKARPKPAPAAKPKSSSEQIVEAYALNVLLDARMAPTFCKPVKFAYLADVMLEHGGNFTSARGEFESTADYNDRIARFSSILSGMGPVSVCIDLNSEARYNADAEEFSFSVFQQPLIYSNEKTLPSALGKTLSGVSFRYERSIEWNYRAVFDLDRVRFQGNCATFSALMLDFKVPHPAYSAPALKADGKLIIQGELMPPFASTSQEEHDATLIERWQSLTIEAELHMVPRKLMVVDGGGEVVWECAAIGPTHVGAAR